MKLFYHDFFFRVLKIKKAPIAKKIEITVVKIVKFVVID